MNKKIALGQFYTPKYISKTMIKIALDLLKTAPQTAIELAAGEGDLILELINLAPSCHISAVDIDCDNASLLKELNKNFTIYNADSTLPLDFLEGKSFQFALGNPPFLSNILVNEYIQEILHKYLGLKTTINQNIRAEYVFICQYLSLLEPNGLLAIILPESIISGHRSKKIREALLSNWQIEQILEVCGHPFDSTEAKTHILFIRKAKPTKFSIAVNQLTSSNQIHSLNLIEHNLLKERMDFSFLSNLFFNPKKRKLGDFAEIIRGKKSHKDLKIQGTPYIHTTNIHEINFPSMASYNSKCIVKDGDILMCRVGSRIIGKTILFNGTATEISDCLYIIKFKDEEIKKEFFDYVNSEIGMLKLKSIARGVCSRYITKQDLLEFLF